MQTRLLSNCSDTFIVQRGSGVWWQGPSRKPTGDTSDPKIRSFKHVRTGDTHVAHLGQQRHANRATELWCPGPLVYLTCLRGWHLLFGVVRSYAVPSTWTPACTDKGAAEERSDAVILAAVILVAVLDREVEASCGPTPKVVKARDRHSRVFGDFRRVVSQESVHELDNQFAERRVPASVVDLIANCNELRHQVFALMHGEVTP